MLIRKILISKAFYVLLVILCATIIITNLYKVHPKINLDNVFLIEDLTLKDDKAKIVLKEGHNKILCTYYLNETKFNALEGQKIKIQAVKKSISNNTVPNNFNYKNYLKSKKIYEVCEIKSYRIVNKKISLLYRIKLLIQKRMNQKKLIKSYLYTFVLGDKSFLDENMLKAYRLNGVTHLFAISGMHITMFSSFLIKVLKRFKISEDQRIIICMLFIWLYAFLSGFMPSILRAGLFFTILSISNIFVLEIKPLRALIITVFILLLCNPYIYLDISFLYSFLSSFGLVYFLGGKTSSLLKSSFIASIFTLPITINNFYSFNVLSLFINILFIPMVSIIYPLCLINLFLPIDYITFVCLKVLEMFNIIFSKITLFSIISPKINIVFIVIYYIVLIKSNNYKKIIFMIIVILIMCRLSLLFDSSTRIIFLDVGQGDSILIYNSKHSILIDTGGTYSNYHVSSQTVNYLKSVGIIKLSTLVLSHGDYDHMGESINLVSNFKVEKVIFNCGPYNDLEKELIEVLNKKKVKYYSCIKELNIDKSKLYFQQTKIYDNENDNSNVIYTEISNYKFMFMGDAGVTTEKEILDKYDLSDIDVLKVGHHGSKTSSSKEFINEISPNYSVISVGKNNRYGHPNKEVLDNLKDTKIYRTDEDGSIMFNIKNNKLKIETCEP